MHSELTHGPKNKNIQKYVKLAPICSGRHYIKQLMSV